MARDRIKELRSIKERAGRFNRVPTYGDLIPLKDFWENNKRLSHPMSELIPVRIVTLLEVFLRRWLQTFIDHGAPYVERAAKLNANIKYDFAIARSLQGGSISLGELIGHSVSLSQLESISSTFNALLDQDLLGALASVRDRWEVKQHGEAVGVIIADVNRLRGVLTRLFEVRNILVHEMPERPPHDVEEVSQFLDGASEFIRSAEWLFSDLLYGERALTQAEMTQEAHSDHMTAMGELEALCKTIAEKAETKDLDEVQRAWVAYKEAEANRQTLWHHGGSIRPMIYHLVSARLTRDRIEQLKELEEQQNY